MEQRIIMEALVQVRRMGTLLNEVIEVSHQMLEALDRGDQVVIQMYVAMRAEPIQKLKETDQLLRGQLERLGQGERDYLADLLNGISQPKGTEEELLFKQAASNRRLHEQAIELDLKLNRKIMP